MAEGLRTPVYVLVDCHVASLVPGKLAVQAMLRNTMLLEY